MASGKLHLLVLHLPIALILASALADLLYACTRRGSFRSAGFYCLVLGAVSAIPTAVSGLLLADELTFTGQMAQLVETHEHLGIAATGVVLAGALLRVLRRDRLSSWWAWLYGLLQFAAVVLVSAAGHYGGMLAFGPEYLKGVF